MRLMVLAAFAAVSIMESASAATTLSSVATDLSDAVGGNSDFYHYIDTDGLAGREEIRWGNPGSPNQVDWQSGQRFSAAPAQAIVQGTPFTLGVLTHYNNPVFDAISSVGFSVSPGLIVDGAALATGPFTFTIDVDETPNEDNPALCPYPSNLGCSDKISLRTGAATQVFQLGDQTLTLYIDGFLDAQLVPQSSFIAQEEESTTATLIAHFDVASAVPEPASWAMMVADFGIFGGAMRRQGRRIQVKTVRSPV